MGLRLKLLLGFIGIAGFFVLAFVSRSMWIGILSAFMLLNCWGGLRHAQSLLRLAKVPRRPGFACPSCRTEPPLGPVWQCGVCGEQFDTFATGAVCPGCATQHTSTTCMDCGERAPFSDWSAWSHAASGAVIDGSGHHSG